jgi:hypothetical protein
VPARRRAISCRTEDADASFICQQDVSARRYTRAGPDEDAVPRGSGFDGSLVHATDLARAIDSGEPVDVIPENSLGCLVSKLEGEPSELGRCPACCFAIPAQEPEILGSFRCG